MLWEQVRASFEDELEKISEFNLQGLSPEAVLMHGQPPAPMPSAAYEKAVAILDRRDGMGAEKVAESHPFPQQEHKRLGAHLLGGAGAGQIAATLLGGPDPRNWKALRWYGAAGGAALGAAEYGRKRIKAALQQRKEKAKQASPAMSLKASKQVAKAVPSLPSPPGVKAQTPGLIGRKFTRSTP